MSSNNNLPVPAEYQQSSQRFSIIWNDYVDREEKAKSEIINMVKILESNGYSRTGAIEKIKEDHRHLKGFSRMTIYRQLPDDMKRKYESSNIIMLPDNSNVSNDTFEHMEESSADEQLDIETLQERKQELTEPIITKHLIKLSDDEFKMIRDNGGICPFTITCDPVKRTNTIRINKTRLIEQLRLKRKK